MIAKGYKNKFCKRVLSYTETPIWFLHNIEQTGKVAGFYSSMGLENWRTTKEPLPRRVVL